MTGSVFGVSINQISRIPKIYSERSGWHALLRHPRLITGRIGICRKRTDGELQRLVALGHGEDVPEPHIVDTVARRECSIAANYLLPLVPTHRRCPFLWNSQGVASVACLPEKQCKERYFGRHFGSATKAKMGVYRVWVEIVA